MKLPHVASGLLGCLALLYEYSMVWKEGKGREEKSFAVILAGFIPAF